jgi:hypothetical protein
VAVYVWMCLVRDAHDSLQFSAVVSVCLPGSTVLEPTNSLYSVILRSDDRVF